MAYVRDWKTGKFKWVDGQVGDDDDQPFVPKGGKQARASGGSAIKVSSLVMLVGLVAALGIAVAWSQNTFREPSVSIRRIHNHPDEFDGRQVMVRGKVGAVFRMGGSYAYYLLQDRDTIVVFSKSGRPKSTGDARVHGSVSIGYLDGVPRPALFTSGSD